MKSLPLSTLFSLFLSWKILQSFYLTEAEYLSYSGCNSSFTYSPGSVFEQNLNQALTSLVSNSSEYSVYSSITVGKSPDTVYGVVQCFFPRFSAENCQICIKTAATEIRQNCPTQKMASLVYDRCSIEYFTLSPVNTSFPTLLLCETTDYAVEPVLFNLRLRKLFDNLSFSAESDDSKIAVGNISIRSDKNIYGLVQCIADLENGSCFTCLQFIFNYTQRCNLKVGVRFYSMNCFLRYEIYPFFQASVQLSPPHIAPSPASLLKPNSTPTASTNATNPTGKKNTTKTIVVVMTVVTALLVIAIFCACIVRRNAKKKRADGSLHEGGSFHEDDSSSILSFFIGVKSIQAATENFSDKYKLGSGGFGTVYKGKLHDGREIAVKRMSSHSVQGIEELKTEVMVVAKLLHKNLVRLLGFSLEDNEKLLVYEYLPNGSLDKTLFVEGKQNLLDWKTRYQIIVGIARGLLYLHEESQLKIIHRDLKASNILLDENMNPKISDFGLAKLFCESQTHGRTNRISGTFGYMAPEYVMNGKFSTKSDVYSFGILVLEIITGRKNSSFRNLTNLQSHAWEHWSKGTALELMDPTMGDEWPRHEALKCIQMGLLCVQEAAANRPKMSEVVLILDGYAVPPSMPSRPGFFISEESDDSLLALDFQLDEFTTKESHHTKESHQSVNQVTITELNPRD
ncbi:cysteine-rich receptor-like protein kinase 6 isoform X1 [Ziziphus jujuba]|uniref:Cysteine-rich receptor-like protein kinase 6 isoform X1 n=1 Tax=Ziziphus jujuba TaxID=326968 RepID=A0A6P4AYY4_ZIZJJ|nr:cysteine-rich receptor-like protein kinase 6 isoform X1 [Ziziphus jujuba]